MAWKWKTAPVYPGVELDLGDTSYTPGTNRKDVYHSTKLIPDSDYDRINKQTSGNINYIMRPYSQSSWRPNVTKPQVTKNSKAPTTSTSKPRTNTSSTTSRPRTALAPKTPVSNSWINKGRGDIRQGMRANGINPYDYSDSDIKQLKTYLNNPTTDNYTQSVSKIIGDGKIQQNMLNNAVQNQTSWNNQLVNLKFKKGEQMYKYAAGAQMVQPQQTNSQNPIDQIAQIAAESLQGDENSKQQLIQVLSNKEIAPKLLQIVDAGVKNQDKRAVIIAQAIKALQQGSTRKARLGAKLDYIKQSIGECPEGQEVVYFKKGGEICKICAGKKMQDGGKSDPIKNFKKKKDVAKQTYQRNPYTRGKSAKEIAEMQRRNRQEASEGKGENDANVAPWNYKKKKMK